MFLYLMYLGSIPGLCVNCSYLYYESPTVLSFPYFTIEMHSSSVPISISSVSQYVILLALHYVKHSILIDPAPDECLSFIFHSFS